MKVPRGGEESRPVASTDPAAGNDLDRRIESPPERRQRPQPLAPGRIRMSARVEPGRARGKRSNHARLRKGDKRRFRIRGEVERPMKGRFKAVLAMRFDRLGTLPGIDLPVCAEEADHDRGDALRGVSRQKIVEPNETDTAYFEATA